MAARPGAESRRSARVATTFFVAIEGIDRSLVARKGDISATGIYFESETSVGAVGSVQLLTIASSNRAREIRLMAHVVRTVALDDVGGRRVYGVAFEFMPESAQAAEAVERFVQYVLLVVAEPASGQPRLAPRLEALALAEAGSDDRAVVRQLSVRSMTLEASWGVAPGERLRVEIAAPGRARRIRLEGSAVRVTPLGGAPDDPPYEIEVEFQSEVERPATASSTSLPALRPDEASPKAPKAASAPPLRDDDDVSRVLDDLFSVLIHPPEDSRPKREHLSGMLARIRLPTLCALFDMERLSGELRLRNGDDAAVIFVKDGRLVDVDWSTSGASPRDQIGQLLAWTEGSFEFVVQPVDRPDRVAMGTTALLLDLAREADESTRNPPVTG